MRGVSQRDTPRDEVGVFKGLQAKQVHFLDPAR